MTAARAYISLQTRLASALLTLGDVPFEHAKMMSAAQICSLYEWHHFPIPKAEDGPDDPWNIVPRLRADHKRETRTIDVPGIAKRKRVARAYANHQAVMAAKTTGEQVTEARRRRPKIRSRVFSKQHRPLRSGNNLKRKRRDHAR